MLGFVAEVCDQRGFRLNGKYLLATMECERRESSPRIIDINAAEAQRSKQSATPFLVGVFKLDWYSGTVRIPKRRRDDFGDRRSGRRGLCIEILPETRQGSCAGCLIAPCFLSEIPAIHCTTSSGPKVARRNLPDSSTHRAWLPSLLRQRPNGIEFHGNSRGLQ